MVSIQVQAERMFYQGHKVVEVPLEVLQVQVLVKQELVMVLE